MYLMNWKYIKIGVFVFLGLLIILPSLLWVSNIDWSEKHRARVAALPVFSNSVDEGEYRLSANGLEFLVRVAGMQNEGPAVVLLHGFPESSLMWEPLLEKAAIEGYRVVAFDQRGYSPEARPSRVAAYQIDSLVQDVIAVANQVGFDTFHLVGHDWGSGVGWKTVMDFPERIHTWTALSIPHIGVFFNSILNHPEQKKRSAYIDKLKMPFLPEFLFYLNPNKISQKMEGRWTAAQLTEYLAIQQEYGATTAALNWYRAIDIEKAITEKSFEKNIHRPTLFIWGTKDPVIAGEIIPLQEDFIKAPYRELPLETGHSLMQLEKERVVSEILKHFVQ